jgi:hypothetical protein
MKIYRRAEGEFNPIFSSECQRSLQPDRWSLVNSSSGLALANWLPVQDSTRTSLTYLTEAQASRVQELERLVA